MKKRIVIFCAKKFNDICEEEIDYWVIITAAQRQTIQQVLENFTKKVATLIPKRKLFASSITCSTLPTIWRVSRKLLKLKTYIFFGSSNKKAKKSDNKAFFPCDLCLILTEKLFC